MKKFVTILLLSLTMTAFAQKAKMEPMFTFAGKSGDISMTWDEFSKAKKELSPAGSVTSIKSFTISVLVVSDKGSVYIDYANPGNKFSAESIAAIEKMQKSATPGNQILVESVIVNKDKQEVKSPGMLIKLK